jgi:hypothetical protein
VFGLPHSGTTWAANWLTTDQSFCHHDNLEITMSGGYVRGMQRQSVGLSCTGSWMFGWTDALRCPIIILDRDHTQVQTSIQSIGLDPLPDIMLDRFSTLKGLRVAFTDLFNPTHAMSIWSHLLPTIPFDEDRHALLRNMVIRSDGRMTDDDFANTVKNVNRLKGLL